jgi:hypothetical protein
MLFPLLSPLATNTLGNRHALGNWHALGIRHTLDNQLPWQPTTLATHTLGNQHPWQPAHPWQPPPSCQAMRMVCLIAVTFSYRPHHHLCHLLLPAPPSSVSPSLTRSIPPSTRSIPHCATLKATHAGLSAVQQSNHELCRHTGDVTQH